MSAVVAVDLGGTKLAAAVIDESGNVLSARKTPVEKSDAEQTVAQIVQEAGEAVKYADLNWSAIGGVGLIVPGIVDAAAGTAWAPNVWGDRDVPLAAKLSSKLPVPLCIEGDRAGYVLGEQWMGIARGVSDVVFVAVGTGIGACIISCGRLLRGACDAAGSVGWFALNPITQDLYRRIGCWEAEAAGPALARHAGLASAEYVLAAARRGDHDALLAVQRTIEYLAMGIANLISVLNPQMVVLGGGLFSAGDLFLEPIRRAVPQWAQPRAAACARIELSTLGDRAGLFGAARIALSGLC
jgi:glucokinase